ncbi:bZIP transcription factor 44-like [Andrographis paniculata]|uniref:bZIP transcription factor 44-like n=1 Tax=Andrographis paniculata TaxID=175694 RepID=UPI0021E772CC|nr:bZIP transcription factor 44-like [Andrographis paniculata]
MVYSSGTCSGSDLINQKKKKRMESNRESARRSRLRKQQHLDDLTARLAELRRQKDRISIELSATKEQTVSVEADNSVLKAQLVELTHRLQSLRGILSYISSPADAAASGSGGAGSCMAVGEEEFEYGEGLVNYPWGLMEINKQYPIMASSAAERFDC